ncbi:pilus assembly protein TadG-related protein [Actinoallomurus sp. NPDC052274]|uniref:TadE/TadG family type IV pilus assembly protein n=1 Tax=Actinoallomurus sp. NPDC052274 TaxID=3155420 RepID=UPI00344A6253
MPIIRPQARAGERSRRERGALSIFTVIITMVVIVFFGAIVDFSQKLEARHDANVTAEEAARAGAGQVDRDRAYAHGSFRVDREGAIHTAQEYLRAGGYHGSATPVGAHRIRVRVTVTRPAIFLPVIGITSLHADATADADLATGIKGENR